MCLMCDGDDEEAINRGIELSIITHGWSVQSVGPRAGDVGAHWAYTIGLGQSYGLAELVVTDLAHPRGAQFLNWAGAELSAGRSLDDLAGDGVRWRPVHDDHLMTGLVASWEDFYRASPVIAEFVQLIPHFDPACPCCPSVMADLSDPDEGFPDNRGFVPAA